MLSGDKQAQHPWRRDFGLNAFKVSTMLHQTELKPSPYPLMRALQWIKISVQVLKPEAKELPLGRETVPLASLDHALLLCKALWVGRQQCMAVWLHQQALLWFPVIKAWHPLIHTNFKNVLWSKYSYDTCTSFIITISTKISGMHSCRRKQGFPIQVVSPQWNFHTSKARKKIFPTFCTPVQRLREKKALSK